MKPADRRPSLGSTLLSAALRIAATVWRRHFRVPEWAYWTVLVTGLAAAGTALLSGLYSDLFDGEAFDRQFVGGLTVAGVTFIFIAVCATGIVRWHRDRRKARGGLVVPRFHETAGARERGRDAQLIVLDSLQEHVPEGLRSRVHGVNAGIDLQQREFAVRLLRRLRAEAVLHGRVVDRAEGGWTVHARLALVATGGLTHYDWHTNDATPGRMGWAAMFSKLPSTYGVTDEEFPLELTRDLEALVRATAGAVGIAETPAAMEALLREALEASRDSASPAMDVLRTQLAMAIFFQRREDEALELLRERIEAGNAFGELLRGFGFLADARRAQIHAELQEYGLPSGPWDEENEDDEEIEADEDEPDEEALTPQQSGMLLEADRLMEQSMKAFDRSEKLERQAEKLHARVFGEEFGDFEAHEKKLRALDASLREEIIAALITASDDEHDPRRDMSLYNLVNALLSAAAQADEQEEGTGEELRQEAWGRLEQLRERSAYYRQTWYVKRLCGLRAWRAFQAISAGDGAHSPEGIEAAREAATWYSAAIRARPRFVRTRLSDDPVWKRYRLRSRRSPILDANAYDAHFFAGHRVRASYHNLRVMLRRRALLRGAYSDLIRGYGDLAFIQLDWVKVGRHNPSIDRYDAVEAVAVAARDRLGALMRESSAHAAHTVAEKG